MSLVGTVPTAVAGSATSVTASSPFAGFGGDARGPVDPDAPDIVIVMLDGYPRSDVLRDSLDFDNRPRSPGFPLPSSTRAPLSADWIFTRAHHRLRASLLTDSPLLRAPLAIEPQALLAQHRDRSEHALDQVVVLAADDGAPTFAVVHLLSPHPPSRSTAPADWRRRPPACRTVPCGRWSIRRCGVLLSGQVEHLNELVIEAAAAAIAENPNAVLVVMSDHGMRPPGAEEEAMVMNFTAVRMPGSENAIPADLSPVNLLPVILNSVFGTNLETFAYRGWISESEHPLNMRSIR